MDNAILEAAAQQAIDLAISNNDSIPTYMTIALLCALLSWGCKKFHYLSIGLTIITIFLCLTSMKYKDDYRHCINHTELFIVQKLYKGHY